MKSLENQNDKKLASIDLKLKITDIFSKLRPENQRGFIEKMNKFDEISRISISSLIGGGGEGSNVSPPQSPKSIASNDSNSVFSFLDEDADRLKELEEAADEFIQQQYEKAAEGEVIENVALPESKTIYRDDEIVAELMDYFRDSDKSAIFSNSDKLKLWVDDLMGLVKSTSVLEDEKIISAKEVDEHYKPIVQNINNGEGSGVNWLGTISEETKKMYITAEAEQQIFVKERKIIEADPSNQDPETKFNGYDQQQERLYQLSKAYELAPSCETGFTKSKLSRDDQVYTISSIGDDKVLLDKRVLDDGVYRLENIFESKKKQTKAKKPDDKKPIAYGRKGITGVDEVEIVERESICPKGFVLKTPCSKKEYREGMLYPKKRIILTPEVKANNIRLSQIVPFRQTGEQYVVIEQFIKPKDPLALDRRINHSTVDPHSIPVSNVQISDKVIIRFVYPEVNDLGTVGSESILPVQPKFDLSRKDVTRFTLPSYVDILVQVIDKDIGQYNIQDNLYHYKDGSTSATPNCKINVIPMISHKNIITPAWENEFITINNPRIIHKFKCDCDTLKVGDKPIVSLTRLQVDKYLNKMPIVPIPDKSRNFIGKGINHLGLSESESVLQVEIMNKTDDLITFKVILNCSGPELKRSQSDCTMSREEFRHIYISKHESVCDIIDTCLESIKLNPKERDVTYIGNFYDSHRDIKVRPKIEQKTQVWCKVLASFRDVNNRDLLNRHEDVYLVQILQSSLIADLGEFLLVPSEMIKYKLDKYIFERELLGTGDMIKWMNGVLLENTIEDVVPTVQEFMNRISKNISRRDNINNSFINDLLAMALNYDVHQIPSNVRERLNFWIEWSLANNIEKSSREIVKMRESYQNLLDTFNSTNILSTERFRLIHLINEEALINYSKWKIAGSLPNYAKYRNKDLVSTLTKSFDENTKSWNGTNKEKLASYQFDRIREQKVPVVKKWDKIQVPRSEERIKELKVLEAIYTINDPVVRNNLLLRFIQNNCYLSLDISTGKEWYYSKIDSTRTKLICPHVYAEITGKSLDRFSLEVDKGAVVCNNCGQMLNTLVFSYFQGYGDEAVSREKVTIVNGKELVGTMRETEITILNEHVFDELKDKLLFDLETKFNDLIKVLNPELFTFFETDEGKDVKMEAINLIRNYLLDINITEHYFDIWYEGNRMFKERKITKQAALPHYQRYMESRTHHAMVARIIILFEKQVPQNLKIDSAKVLDKLAIYLSTAPKTIFSANKLEDEKTKVMGDYDKLKKYLVISNLYQYEPTIYVPESEKLAYENKFESYTLSDINSSLTLYDAIMWLRFYIRNSHKNEFVIPETEEINCGKDGKQSYTNESQLELVQALEAFIESKMPSDENRTGVKSRVHVAAEKTYIFPEIVGNEKLAIEAKYISKNLFGNDKPENIANITANMDKYRYVDYLVAYIVDENTDKVVPRIFENGIDEITKLDRNELIESMIVKAESILKKEYDELKSKEVQVEATRALEDDCETVTFDSSSYEILMNLISQYLRNLISRLDEEERNIINVPKFIDTLRNLEKEYTIDGSGQKLYAILNIKETEPKKILQAKNTIAIKEYEKLTKLFNYFKRDYNYLSNKTNLIERKSKLANKLELEIKEGDDIITSFQTDYDYLIDYMFNKLSEEELSSLSESLVKLKSDDFKIIESIECEKSSDEYKVLLERNITNKYVLAFTVLRILLQYQYDQDVLNVLDKDIIRSIDVSIEEEADIEKMKQLAVFIVEFVMNMNKIFGRESEVLHNIFAYKQETYELVSLMERTRRMKYADNIGLDLMREFNKVMKGKRKLEVKELASDNALESAKKENLSTFNFNVESEYEEFNTNNYNGDDEGDRNVTNEAEYADE